MAVIVFILVTMLMCRCAAAENKRFLFDPTPPPPVSCTFDYSSCNFANFFNNVPGFAWKQSQRNSNPPNGPIRDHTTGNGAYMYFLYQPRVASFHTGYLVTPTFDTYSQPMKVTFWKNMKGSHIGSLSVYFGKNTNPEAIFQQSMITVDTWESVCMDLPTNTHQLQVSFVAGTAIHSDVIPGYIAIDDVRVSTGSCSHAVPTIPPVQLTTQVPHYTFKTTVSAYWSPWYSWTQCSASCGGATRQRTRYCVNGNTCTGNPTDVRTCGLPACPIDGEWSPWSAWSTCSVTCDLGQLSRKRFCNNPAPAHGGSQCTGNYTEVHECSSGPCPTWSAWFDGSCSVTCGSGTQPRLRECSTGISTDCTGSSHEKVTCQAPICV